MRMLILGGTVYLGRHLVDAAVAAGHRVTLFNRGLSNPDLFPDLEQLRGDRERDLQALAGHSWDCVLDTSGYLPRAVSASARALSESIEHYTFVSSISVYADNTQAGLTEADPVAELAPGAPEELSGETYGALKAGCERALQRLLPGRVAIVRAGLIYGPHDTTDRSGYWPLRLLAGGDVLAPGTADRPIQLIDVRDLARWMIELAESQTTGVMNATGPGDVLTFGEYLETCREVSGARARYVWMDEAFLLERKVAPYNELPLWVPEGYHAFGDVDCHRAIEAGLTYRPLGDTIRDTLAWARSLPPGERPSRAGLPIGPGLSREREAELLAQWQSRHAARSRS